MYLKFFLGFHVFAQAPEVPKFGPESLGKVGNHVQLIFLPQ